MKHIGLVVGLFAFVAVAGNVVGDDLIVPANCQIIGEAELVELHLNGGSPFGRTTVSLTARVSASLSDFYIFAAEDGSGTEVFRFAGWADPDTGDFVVESLD